AWEGVTLMAPVVVRNIEVEADLERMKASDITRATVQIHYQKFGQEVEENIQVSPLKNEPLISKKIFLDRGVKGYVYRIVFNHKKEGKLALPWSAQVGDNYIYVKIPENLLVDGPAKDQAKSAAAPTEGSASEKVLGKFKDLVGERT